MYLLIQIATGRAERDPTGDLRGALAPGCTGVLCTISREYSFMISPFSFAGHYSVIVFAINSKGILTFPFTG